MTKLTLQPGTFTYNKDDDDLARTVPVAHILLDGKDFIRQIRTWTHDKHLSPLEPDILYDMLHHEWKDDLEPSLHAGRRHQRPHKTLPHEPHHLR